MSACLLGVPCRYDGGEKGRKDLMDALAGAEFLPVCPEEMGGLPTPRPPCAIQGGAGPEVLTGTARVLTLEGGDRTHTYLEGARRTLLLLQARGITTFYAKAWSPSCGLGTHSVFGEPAEGDGVTTALLKQHGVQVIEVQDSL